MSPVGLNALIERCFVTSPAESLLLDLLAGARSESRGLFWSAPSSARQGASGAQLLVRPPVVQILQPRQGFPGHIPLPQDLGNRLRRETRHEEAPHEPCRLF